MGSSTEDGGSAALNPPRVWWGMPGRIGVLLAGVLTVLLAGCATAATPTSTPLPTLSQPGQGTVAGVTAPAPTASPPPSSESSGGLTLTLEEDSVARYLVREQLAGLSVPNDAVGETPDVSGSIIFDGDGRIDSTRSELTVDLSSLQSDESRRDNYLRTRSLQSNTYPTARFAVHETPGLPWPLPAQGERSFQIVGAMTVRAVTRPLTWEVTAQFGEDTASGQARASFTFDEFQMDQPSVSIVLSVDNEIRLELDFTATVDRQSGP